MRCHVVPHVGGGVQYTKEKVVVLSFIRME